MALTAPTSQETPLAGAELVAWRSLLKAYATIIRELDTELVASHGLTTRDYEVLLHLAQAEDGRLGMSALARGTMLTRSGITRLVDGLVGQGLVRRVSCEQDARVSYAELSPEGLVRLREAGCGHVRAIRRLFLAHFDADEVNTLAGLLERLPGASGGGGCSVA